MSISIHLVSACSIIAPIIIGAIYVKSLPFALKILFVFLLIMGGLELISTILSFNQVSNLAFFHAFAYIEFTAIAFIFFFSYDSVFWRGVSMIFLAGFLVFSVVNNIYYEPVDGFNTNQRYVEGMLAIILCAGYYISLLRRPVHRYLERQPMFWLASGWLIYFAGTLYLFLFSKELLAMDTYQWWTIHAVLNIGLNLVFLFSFLKGRNV